MGKRKLIILGILIGGLLPLLLCGISVAQYPTDSVTVFVGYAPGGTVDLTGRFLSSMVEKSLGKPFVVVNKPGASSSVALAEVARANPDGYTLLFAPSQVLVLTPHVLKVAYSYHDVTPIVSSHLLAQGICVRADAPWKTFKEFVEYARGQSVVVYGTSGMGSSSHLTPLYIAKKEGINLRPLPFAGGAKANEALLGGHVKVISATGSHIPYVKEGKFRLLAVYTEKRSELFPDVPTIFELGYKEIPRNPPHVLLAPKGIPKEVKDTLERAFTEAIKSKGFGEFLKRVDAELAYANSVDTEKQIETDYVEWGKIIKEVGFVAKGK
jgi:tripartite-type tricarboxylate transporter receptor subunit TctC